MTTTAPTSEAQTFTITEEIAVHASLDKTSAPPDFEKPRRTEAREGAPQPRIREAPHHDHT